MLCCRLLHKDSGAISYVHCRLSAAGRAAAAYTVVRVKILEDHRDGCQSCGQAPGQV
jgi:hypothetical protein